MTDSLIERAEKALEGITPGPWVCSQDDCSEELTVGAGTFLVSPGRYLSSDCIHEVDVSGYDPDDKDYLRVAADAEFIAQARTLIPELIVENKRLQALVNDVVEVAVQRGQRLEEFDQYQETQK
jgi:hypothetical protein